MRGSIKLINIHLKYLQMNFKKKSALNKELRLLKKYVKVSDLFIGDKKKIYTLINRYIVTK
jgi:hypothetical protein